MAVTYPDGLPACEQSPIQVVTGRSVDVCVSMGVYITYLDYRQALLCRKASLLLQESNRLPSHDPQTSTVAQFSQLDQSQAEV